MEAVRALCSLDTLSALKVAKKIMQKWDLEVVTVFVKIRKEIYTFWEDMGHHSS